MYGTTVKDSDVDIRGVFIPSSEYFFGFLNHVEQIEESNNDVVYFDIRKFFKLALDCNPNIVELLFVPREMSVTWTEEWEEIINNRDLFLSRKARYTFSGYAVSQLHRIKQHRNWLLNPPKKQPCRTDFGLPEDRKLVTKDQLNAFDELTNTFNYELIEDFELDANALYALQQEKAFQNANKEWNQYENWKNTRNPARAELEAKYGFDTKHGMHLFRLLQEGMELLMFGNIILPRPNAQELIDIRNGRYSYDELIISLGDVDKRFDFYYEHSKLPNSPNRNEADKLCIKLVKQYLGI